MRVHVWLQYNSLGSLESHLVLALPEAVLQKAAAACPGAPVLQQQQQQQLGGEGGGGDALRALTTNLRAAFACVNTKNDFLGRPKGRACGWVWVWRSWVPARPCVMQGAESARGSPGSPAGQLLVMLQCY